MVEWKKLGEICTYYRGVTYNKKQEVSLGSGGTKILRANNITLDSNTLNFDDIKEISSDVKIKDYQWLNPNDILICAGSGSKEHVGKVAFIFDRIGYAYGGFMGKLVVSGGLQSRFLFHVICSHLFKKYLEVALNSTTINNLNAEIVNNFLIPVPSFSEQSRIVGILDTFTASIENLKQQIAQRRKQYEHYREQLLDLEGKEGVEIKTIGEVCKTITPPKKLATKNYQLQGLFPIIDQGQSVIVGYTDDESALVPNGEYVLFGDHTRFVKFYKGRFAQGADGLKILKVKDFVSSRYFYFAFSNAEVPSRGYSRHWSIAKELPIPVPSITEQQRIVSILDTFEASIANLEQQLVQRERQYEYYRNKLLTFE